MKNNPLISKNDSLSFKAGMLFSYFKSVAEPIQFFESKLAPELNANAETFKSFEPELNANAETLKFFEPELNANAETFSFFESKLAPELNAKSDVEPTYRREFGLVMKG